MLLSGSLQNGDSAVPPAIWKVLSLLDRPSAFLLCCGLDGKSIWGLQKEMFLRADLENGHSEPVPSERGERVLLLWRCRWLAVLTPASYCHSPGSDSAWAAQTGSGISDITEAASVTIRDGFGRCRASPRRL